MGLNRDIQLINVIKIRSDKMSIIAAINFNNMPEDYTEYAVLKEMAPPTYGETIHGDTFRFIFMYNPDCRRKYDPDCRPISATIVIYN
jgi:hypothetical protein